MCPEDTLLVIFDNGSLRPAAALQLRKMAQTVASTLDRPVTAASVLHSDKIPVSKLEGVPAVLVEHTARDFWERNPNGEVLLVPAFFGPSRAITHYLPGRLNTLIAKIFSHSAARWQMAPSLVECENETDSCNNLVVEALAQEVRRTIAASKLSPLAKVVLVDHGSPEPSVTAVREYLGARLRTLLASETAALATASMERREGERYAFNDPLLAAALRTPPFDEGDIVVLLQFLSPGRHAGEAGDIESICAAARVERPALRTWLTDTIGSTQQIAEVIRRRFVSLINK